MHTGCRTSFATTVRVIDRVHNDTTNRRVDTAPAHRAPPYRSNEDCALRYQPADRCATLNVDSADFARTQSHWHKRSCSNCSRRPG